MVWEAIRGPGMVRRASAMNPLATRRRIWRRFSDMRDRVASRGSLQEGAIKTPAEVGDLGVHEIQHSAGGQGVGVHGGPILQVGRSLEDNAERGQTRETKGNAVGRGRGHLQK